VTSTVRVYINGMGLDAPADATALDAVRAWDPSVAAAIAGGEKRLTDSRGLPTPADAPLHGGAIFRVVPVRGGAADDEPA
jgi:hypothetical protein